MMDFSVGSHGHPACRWEFYIWSNNRDSQSWSRINRFLLSLNWEEQFPDVSQRRLYNPLESFSFVLESFSFVVGLWCVG
jgi:hypothetical protein